MASNETWRKLSLFWVLHLLGYAGGATASLGQSPKLPQPRCSYTRWSPAMAIAVDTAQHLDFASVATGKTGTFLIGSTALASRLTPHRRQKETERIGYFRAFTFEGQPLGLPPGKFVYAYPRAAVDSRGDLHAIWGEPDSLKEAERAEFFEALQITGLWHSVFRNGRWSTPVRVFQAHDIRWDPVATSRLVSDKNMGLHIAFPISAVNAPEQIVYLHKESSGWVAKEFRSETPAVYTDLAVGDNGQRALVFVAAPAPSGQVGEWTSNAIFLALSAGNGVWTIPTQVSRSDQIPGYEPRVLIGNRNQIHVSWTKREDGKAGTELWHISSTNRGGLWIRSQPLRLDMPANRATTAIDNCGIVHGALQIMTPTGPRIAYTRLGKEGWMPITVLHPQRLGALPFLWIDPAEKLNLLFYEAPSNADDPVRYRPVVATMETNKR